ncbi:ComEC Predicted membrane metal-binding protein [Rhabdaerophilaceae bacterium]
MHRPRASQLAEGGRAWPGPDIQLDEWNEAFRLWFGRQLEEERANRTAFLWLPVAFGLGILAYFSASHEPSLGATTAWIAVSILGICLTRGFGRMAMIALAFVALGFAAGILRTAIISSPMLERPGIYKVSGFVEAIDQTTRRHRLTLRITSIEGQSQNALPYRIRVGAPGRPTVLPGSHVSASVRLTPPSDPAMPGGFDFRRDAFFKAIGAVGFTLGRIESSAPPISADWQLRLNAAIDHARNELTNRIASRIGGDAGALAAALITGKRGLISPEANDDLRASGLYHIVSISGLHMVLAAGVMFWSLRAGLALSPTLALRWPIKKLAALGAMIGSAAYCVFSGAEVATERSLIMTLVMLGAILVDRPALAMRNVAISALIVLAREPEALLGPSFQMSFAAVAALIAGNEIWRQYRPAPEPDENARRLSSHDLLTRIMRNVLLAIGGIVATTILASLATAPFSAFHFHRLNPYGLIGNTLAIPLVSLIVMPAAVLGTLLVPLGLDSFVWSLMGEGVKGVLFVAAWVAGIEGAAPAVPRAPPVLFAMLALALLALLLLHSHLRLICVPMLVLWVVLLRALPLPDILVGPDGRMALIRTKAEGGYRLLSPASPPGFTLSQWLPSLGDQRLPNDRGLREGTRCDRFGCVGRLEDGKTVAVSLSLRSVREDCRRAQVIVTPLDLPKGICPPTTIVIARDTLQRHGALRLTLNARDGTLSALEGSIDPFSPRPWRKSIEQDQRLTETRPTPSSNVSPPSHVAERADDYPGLESHAPAPLSIDE